MERRRKEHERAHAERLARHPELARMDELPLSELFPLTTNTRA